MLKSDRLAGIIFGGDSERFAHFSAKNLIVIGLNNFSSVLTEHNGLDKLFGSIGYLRNLVILNCVLAKTIVYFHIVLRHVFFFCDYNFSYCMKPSGMCLHIYSLPSSAFLKYQTRGFYCT